MRATIAMSRAASASAGMITDFHPSRPKLGSHPSFTEKNDISTSPSQKFGTASNPTTDTEMA